MPTDQSDVAGLAERVDAGRLWQAWTNSRLALRIYRENRREAVRQYVGMHYSEEGTKKEVPINLLSLYAGIVTRNLIAKSPRVNMTTFDRQMKPTVSAMNDWMNQKLRDMEFATIMQRVALDAIFGIGIGKIALATPADAASSSYGMPAGEVFFESIDLDDFAMDTHARSLDKCSWYGHRYRAIKEVVQDSKLYSGARKDLQAAIDNPYNRQGDERIGMIARGYWSDTEEYEDYVDLYEFYLPRERLVVTMTEEATEPLRVQRWIGPKCGPYHFLGMGIVPGNFFPKAPIMDLIDLHAAGNRGYRKLVRQNDRQKQILLVAGGADEDGNRILKADDGEAIRVDNPERAKAQDYGGVNQQAFGFAVHLHDLFSKMAGNLDMMGGLSPQSNTLGQDEMLAKNATRQITDMQDRTVVFVQKAVQSLAWFWWHDPYTTHRSVYQLPGAPEMQIERKVKPEDRMGMIFEDLDLQIDPYSLAPSTPQARLGILNQIVTQIAIPMQQMLEKQGVTVDFQKFLEITAKYANLPELSEILTFQEAAQEESKPAEGGDEYTSNAPANTTRTYERVSRSAGGTPSGQNANLITNLMAGGGDEMQKLPKAMQGQM